MKPLLPLAFLFVPLAAQNITAGPPKLEADRVAAGEGPSWDPRGFLYFTGQNRISRRNAEGAIEIYRNPANGANGTLVDTQGRLVVCEAAARRVTRTELDGSVTVLAETYESKRFNSPNDLSIDAKGRIYFTDPRYGNRETMEMRDDAGRTIEGVYRIDGPGKVVRILTHEVERPNGILVAPDGRSIYVADNNNNNAGGARKLWRFDLTPEGAVQSGTAKVIFDWHTARGPDGIKMDQAGRLFVAGGLNKPNPPFETADEFKGGVFVISPEGKLLEFIAIPRDEVTNCAFGGMDLKTLYITAGGSLWSVRVNTPGRISAHNPAERASAEWVIRRNGRVFLDDSRTPISRVDRLPATHFVVTGVDLMGTTIEPRELENISSLVHVRELYLPGASWTPGAGNRLDANDALRHLSGFTRLERLQFSLHFLPYFNLTDVGFGHISNLTQLQELRCAQCRIQKQGLAPFTNLRSLDLSYSTFNDEAMRSLEGMRDLRRLSLHDTSVTNEGLRHIAGLTHLEELDLSGLRVTDDAMASLAGLTRIRKLNLLGSPVTDEGVRVLAGMPHLRELNLYRSAITNTGLATLASLKELTTLDLRYSRVTTSGVQQLRAAVPSCSIEFAGPPPAPLARKAMKPEGASPQAVVAWIKALGGSVVMADGRIREISLASAPLTDAHVAFLPDVEVLDLSATEIGDLALSHIARLTRLTRLNLASTTVSDSGLAALAPLSQLQTLVLSNTRIAGTGLPSLPALRVLDLTSCPVKNDALPAIAALPALERLSLAGSDITGAGLTHLASLAGLQSLNLASTDVGDEGLRDVGALTNLRDLSLRHTRFSDEGLALLNGLVKLNRLDLSRSRAADAALAVVATLRELRSLNLDYTAVNTKALEALQAMPELRDLSLDSTDLNDDAAVIIASLPNLESVNLYHTLVTGKGIAAIRAARPNCRIQWERESALPTRRKT